MTPVQFLMQELKPFLKEENYIETDMIFSVANYMERKRFQTQCICEESIGQTWCCNQCGKPYHTRKSNEHNLER